MNANKRSLFKYIIPLLIFLVFSVVAFSYTQITPYLIKVSKIIDVDNPDYFIDLSAPDISIKTAGGINISSGKNLCLGNECVSSWSSLSGVPSGYCVEFYNTSCPSGFSLLKNLTTIPLLYNFTYKRPITITEQSGSDLIDYQINITLDTASLISSGKMRSDCGDIRFTYVNSSGEYEIPYWIEDGTCNTPNTRIWVKVPEIPASSSVTIYLYYGDSSAESKSNITETFVFGDDFNDGTYTEKWTILGGTWIESGGYITMSSETGHSAIKSNVGVSLSNYIVESKAKTLWNNRFCIGGKSAATVSSGLENVMLSVATSYSNDPALQSEIWDGTSRYATGSTQTGSVLQNNTYYLLKAVIFTDKIESYIYSLDGSLITSTSVTHYAPNLGDKIELQCWNPARWDWIIVRKYVSQEPVITIESDQLNKPEYKVICCKQ